MISSPSSFSSPSACFLARTGLRVGENKSDEEDVMVLAAMVLAVMVLVVMVLVVDGR